MFNLFFVALKINLGWEVAAPARGELIELITQFACSVHKANLPLSVVIA